MTIKTRLTALLTVVLDEVDRNPDFRRQVADALGDDTPNSPSNDSTKKRGGRRAPAVLDPVKLYIEGEAVLRDRLETLDLEKLRDIVAEYGMDPGKLVMKWKKEQRVIDHIIETARSRAKKGEAFR